MRSVSIIGIGQTPVGELWDLLGAPTGLRCDLHGAMAEAGVERADALFVGNMLSGSLLDQEHLGTLVADVCGLRGIEAAKVEAACASAARRRCVWARWPSPAASTTS
jgi:acetyl-CoA C-acetyltransferase